jgi:L-threonate 2-dehydrogenase
MDKTVGIIGLGIMGSAIARNLVERGWRVVGFDIDSARRAELAGRPRRAARYDEPADARRS